MPRVEKGGLSGESYKEVWLTGVLQAEHDQHEREFQAMWPKGSKVVSSPYSPPWTSLGQAPTAQNLEDASYGGSA